MKIRLTTRGDFRRTERFLGRMSKGDMFRSLDALARSGVNALVNATPVDSGLTASSWDYKIKIRGASCDIEWFNTHTNDGQVIAILLQYGHGTGTGGYVQGVDYINPAIKPVFDKIADSVWKVVTSA